ncbi:unnamed protein product [Urochloa decumbens]|uniref:FACT complex subunit SSRP1 n=1 Tax=Urochloa decumbens TaxID=240449 RepID=A0ABC9GP20_9POAL
MTDGHHFNNISLGGRGGFDVSNLTNFIQRSTGISPEEKQLSISGYNWGGVEIDGTRLCFNVGEKEAFEVSLADVSQAQMQGKTDVVLQFHVDNTAAANEDHQIHEVFSNILCGISGAKVTRSSTFRSCQHGYAVKSALKAEDGLLYPLEKGFFFLPKPATIILHEEVCLYKTNVVDGCSFIYIASCLLQIEYVLFDHHGASGVTSQYFDLLIKLKNDQEHLFSNIQRIEYQNLFSFISGKNLKVMNLGDGQRRTGGVAAALDRNADDSVDPHLERIKNQACNEESDEKDEDFVVDKDDSGSPSDDSEEESSDASMGGGEKKEQKSGSDEGSQKKKAKRKKDPNAPKRAIVPFMYFSKAERANIKNSNPELTTTEIAKKLGERWQKMTAEERQPYVEQSRVDKQRYEEESAAYHGAAAQRAPGDGSG